MYTSILCVKQKVSPGFAPVQFILTWRKFARKPSQLVLSQMVTWKFCLFLILIDINTCFLKVKVITCIHPCSSPGEADTCCSQDQWKRRNNGRRHWNHPSPPCQLTVHRFSSWPAIKCFPDLYGCKLTVSAVISPTCSLPATKSNSASVNGDTNSPSQYSPAALPNPAL